MSHICNVSGFIVLLPGVVVFCCRVHVTRFVTFQQIKYQCEF